VQLPADVAAAAGVVPSRAKPLPWRHPLWLVECGGAPAVIRKYPAHRVRADVAWEHELLGAVATRFPVPEPVGLFEVEGALWGLVTYLPGRTPAWEAYDLADHGALLARFHAATADLRPLPRPDPVPALYELHDLRDELEALGYSSLPRALVHGDATISNVVVEPVGLLDFAMAHTDAPVADVAFALWQAGRARLPDVALVPERVSAMVAGYHRVRPLDHSVTEVLPVLIRARGLQLVARWTARRVLHQADAQTQARLDWVASHQHELRRAVERGLSRWW